MRALNEQALRILRLFGNMSVKRVYPTVGAEQEYFLIDRKMFDARKDLVLSGRTLFGAKPPKGQELEDHYFGPIKLRVSAFMKELDEELWKLGIFAKTEHNEVAPSQHELAPIFTVTNLASDQNQLIMETMKKVASRHGLYCLLHEKPFKGVNGSGKHNNWSMSTDKGVNLLDPGSTPAENGQFMLFLMAVIAAVDDYQDLLRLTVTSAGNDHRLGANEAPPAIISIYLGDQLGDLVDSIANGKDYVPFRAQEGSIGVPESPIFPKDASDRNRTSPFAFTGNKFEFRMLGSQANVADANIVLNTIISEVFSEFADKLEGCKDIEKSARELITKTIKDHKRIIFNLDGYGPAWEPEAERRGLLNNKNTADATEVFFEKKNIDVFVNQGVYTEQEAVARAMVRLENYVKIINIEALTMLKMAKQDIIPAVSDYIAELCSNVAAKKAISDNIPCESEKGLITRLSALNDDFSVQVAKLENLLAGIDKEDVRPASKAMAHEVIPQMQAMRKIADEMETLTAEDYWPYPSYTDILYSVK